jgi:hypothetical protein
MLSKLKLENKQQYIREAMKQGFTVKISKANHPSYVMKFYKDTVIFNNEIYKVSNIQVPLQDIISRVRSLIY